MSSFTPNNPPQPSSSTTRRPATSGSELRLTGFPDEAPSRQRWLRVLTWTWCLPNTLLSLVAGWLVVRLFDGRVRPFRGAVVVRSKAMRRIGGVCLGPVIIVADTADYLLVLHEWGHFRQHLRLGWFYHLIIGIPSVLHALYHMARRGTMQTYFQFYTEAWADSLAGIYHLHAHVHPHWAGYARLPLLLVSLALLAAGLWGAV